MFPGIIQKLDNTVVNRIAAGEIIQRPANALKELLENSLDAKSSLIQITIKSGGLKLLQIQDNGTGIRREDLEIVCERFTTSKIEKFEDLSNIGTFGFRGEALASISHVAHLTIQTKTCTEICGYKASYEDGKLKGSITPCAGNQGTTITVEDLFYNVVQRKLALRSPNEEFQKISDVVGKYAVHNAKVSFVLKKLGETQTFRTSTNSTTTENIRIIYGNSIAKELIAIELQDDVHQFQMAGLVTNVNYSAKRGTMLLFINQRLVESAALKSTIDTVYSTYLPKGSFPFVYMSIELEPNNVDVNIHPTKHEVHFLHEDEIIEKIKLCLESKLFGSNSTRIFYKQSRLLGASQEQTKKSAKDETFTQTENRVNPKDLVRTDAKEQKLEKFFTSPNKNKIKTERLSIIPAADEIKANATLTSVQKSNRQQRQQTQTTPRKETKLTSVLRLRRRVENACSTQLRKIFREMIFVGIVNRQYSLFQFETKLYLFDILKFSSDLFYQLLIYNFDNFDTIEFDPPLSIEELALIALESEECGWTEEDGPKAQLAKKVVELLMDKSAIMREYYGLKINDEGQLESLPVLLEKHSPPLYRLPMYLLRLATEVDWDSEENCFKTFSHETAEFYSQIPEADEGSNHLKWTIEHILIPAFKKYLIPSSDLKEFLIELAQLPNLYKVFERC